MKNMVEKDKVYPAEADVKFMNVYDEEIIPDWAFEFQEMMDGKELERVKEKNHS